MEMGRRQVCMDGHRGNPRKPHRKNPGDQMIDPDDRAAMGLSWMGLR